MVARLAETPSLRVASRGRGRKRCPGRARVDPANVGLWKLWNWPHVAYRVDNLQEAMAGGELIFVPFDPGGFGQVAFVLEHGVVVEYMEYTDLEHWFGQPNPPGWQPEPF